MARWWFPIVRKHLVCEQTYNQSMKNKLIKFNVTCKNAAMLCMQHKQFAWNCACVHVVQNTLHCRRWWCEGADLDCRYWLYMMVAACSLCLLQSCSVQSFFHFVRLFWYHVFTCFSVSPSDVASVQRSSFVRYFCWPNLLSSSCSCTVVKAVRFFFLKDFIFLGLSSLELLVSSCSVQKVQIFQ